MKSILLAALAAALISPICNAQKLWRQTEYTVYDMKYPSPQPMDSITYYYNAYYGSLPTWDPVKRWIFDPAVEQFKYDSSVHYKYSFGPQPWYIDKLKIQSFDLKGNITNHIIKERRQSNKPPQNVNGSNYTYNAFGQLQTILHLVWGNNQWNDLSRETYTYTGGTLSELLVDTFKSGQWENTRKRDYTYNTGKLNEEVLSTWAGGPLTPVTRMLYNYDASGRLSGKTSQAWSTTSAAWENKIRNLYSYDANGNCITDSTQGWQTSSPTWEIISVLNYQYDSNNNPTGLLEQGWQYVNPPPTKIWTGMRMHNFTFNSNNLISRDERSYWRDWLNDWEPDLAWNYYYQQFTVGIPEVAQSGNNLTLYPNPAITQLHVNAEWKTAQPFTVGILDITGRVLKQWSETASKTYSATIPVMDMPAGNYTIQLNNGEQKISKRFSVLK